MDWLLFLVFEVVCILCNNNGCSILYVVCIERDVIICKIIFCCSLSKLDMVLVLRVKVLKSFIVMCDIFLIVRDFVKGNNDVLELLKIIESVDKDI